MSQIVARICYSLGEVLKIIMCNTFYTFLINHSHLVAFDRWVFHFAHLRQLPVLVPYMPTENPRMRDTAYEVCQESNCVQIFT